MPSDDHDPLVERSEGATMLLDEGADGEDFELKPEEEAEIDDAIAEADRDGWIPPNR